MKKRPNRIAAKPSALDSAYSKSEAYSLGNRIPVYAHPEGYSIAFERDCLYIDDDALSIRIPIGTLGLLTVAEKFLGIVHDEIGGLQ